VRKVVDMKKILLGMLLMLLVAACSVAEPQPTSTQVPPTDTLASPTITLLPPTPDVTTDWPEFVNTELGYSFKYPAGCSLGLLDADCGLTPPEEQSAECLCSLEAEIPGEVRLHSVLGSTEAGFRLASFYVLHYGTPETYPPEGTDLSSWLTSQHHVLPEDMPAEPNLVIDGLPAVRVYIPDFQRTFAAEEIFVISDGKLITIRMFDVDVEEHSELYENILKSLRFSD
jgi:hypothetical protein